MSTTTSKSGENAPAMRAPDAHLLHAIDALWSTIQGCKLYSPDHPASRAAALACASEFAALDTSMWPLRLATVAARIEHDGVVYSGASACEFASLFHAHDASGFKIVRAPLAEEVLELARALGSARHDSELAVPESLASVFAIARLADARIGFSQDASGSANDDPWRAVISSLFASDNVMDDHACETAARTIDGLTKDQLAALRDEMVRLGGGSGASLSPDVVKRTGAVLSRLSPHIRRTLISFAPRNTQAWADWMSSIADRLPPDEVLEALLLASRTRGVMTDSTRQMLNKLALITAPRLGNVDALTFVRQVETEGLASVSDGVFRASLGELMRDRGVETYTPGDYQQQLDRAAAYASHGARAIVEKQAFDQCCLEQRTIDICLAILREHAIIKAPLVGTLTTLRTLIAKDEQSVDPHMAAQVAMTVHGLPVLHDEATVRAVEALRASLASSRIVDGLIDSINQSTTRFECLGPWMIALGAELVARAVRRVGDGTLAPDCHVIRLIASAMPFETVRAGLLLASSSDEAGANAAGVVLALLPENQVLEVLTLWLDAPSRGPWMRRVAMHHASRLCGTLPPVLLCECVESPDAVVRAKGIASIVRDPSVARPELLLSVLSSSISRHDLDEGDMMRLAESLVSRGPEYVTRLAKLLDEINAVWSLRHARAAAPIARVLSRHRRVGEAGEAYLRWRFSPNSMITSLARWTAPRKRAA